eukprot:gb/GEZN01004717.1/.p1 GENE.gb/GEZN01004717.1/~~gb/GEZN01004717.1/.p1  ORF type:complete len:609 (+),score=45.91 gb/GEZN01004717.1/:25-1827(+)
MAQIKVPSGGVERPSINVDERPAAIFAFLTHHLPGNCAALAWGYSLEHSLPMLTILNYENHGSVGHRAVVLRGVLAANVSLLSLRNTVIPREPILPAFSADGRRFKALVELRKGQNRLSFELYSHGSPDESVVAYFHVNYLPVPRSHYVRLIWATASDGDPRFVTPGLIEGSFGALEHEERLRTAAAMLQGAVAECMYDQGFGHSTFHLETRNRPVQAPSSQALVGSASKCLSGTQGTASSGPQQSSAEGKVKGEEGSDSDEIVVHTWKLPQPARTYYSMSDGELWAAVDEWIQKEHSDPWAKNVVLLAFTRRLPEGFGKEFGGHTALGGGQLALFGSASCFAWPTKLSEVQRVFQDERSVPSEDVKDDSGGRGTIWGVVSTSLGAVLHELLHTFGLPHVSDRFDVMSRGFDYLSRRYTFVENKSLSVVMNPNGVWGCSDCTYQNNRFGNSGINCIMCGSLRTSQNAQGDFFPGTEMYLSRIIASYLRWVAWFRRPDGNGFLPDESLLLKEAGPTFELDKDSGSVSIEGTPSSGLGWVGIYDGPDIKSHLELVPPGPLLHPTPSHFKLSLPELRVLVGAGKSIARVSAIGPNGVLNQIYP